MGDALPMDWTVWHAQWDEWRRRRILDGTLQPTSYTFPGKNMLADEILGVWHIGYRNVELSEVTFLDTRGIGITYGTGAIPREAASTEVPDEGVVHSFAELEEILSRDCGVTFP